MASLVAQAVSFSFTDTGLINGVSYTYTITAVNSQGESVPSNAIAATPTGSTTVVTITAGANDGRIQSSNATYLTARSGGTFAVDTTAVSAEAGQQVASSVYYCYIAGFDFDTSAIPTDAVITAAQLDLWCNAAGISSSGAYITQVRLFDWGSTLTSADWVVPGTGSAAFQADAFQADAFQQTGGGGGWTALTLLCHSVAGSALPAGANVTFTDDAFAANVVKGGNTRVLMTTDRLGNGTSPSGTTMTEYATWATSEDGTAGHRPRLTITYTTTSASTFGATSNGVSTTSGTLTTAIRFVATSAGVSATTGSLTTSTTLAATSAGVSTTAGALNSVALAAQLQATSVGFSADFARLFGSDDDISVPVEVTLWNATRTQLLAILEGTREAQWYDPLNDIGTGRFLISRYDPKAKLIAKGQIVTFKLHAVDRYSIIVESRNIHAASSDGHAGEWYEIVGRGAEAILDKARVAPGYNDYGTLNSSQMINSAIAQAQDPLRPVLPSTFSLGFTNGADTLGNVWLDSARYVVPPGSSYLVLLDVMRKLGIDLVMTPALTLNAYRDGFGTDRSLQVVFREGAHTRGEVQFPESGQQRITRVWVEGKSGSVVQVFGNETDPAVGIREGYLKITTTDEPAYLTQVGQQAIAASAAQAQAIKMPLLHGLATGQYEPYLDYAKGDTVKVDIPGVYDNLAARILAITVAAKDDGTYEVDVELNGIVAESLVRLKRTLDQLAVGVG